MPKTGRWFLVIGHWTLVIIPCFLLGCSPSGSPPDARLRSGLFSHVEIIGRRGTGAGELNKPRSVAVDAADHLYVADMTGRVQKFSPAGVFILSWQMPQTDLGKPKGMGRDREGNIVVIEPHYHRLNHFTPDGKRVAQWGEKGTNAGQFTLPRAVAANSHGDLFVTEYSAVDRVQGFAGDTKQWRLGFGGLGSSEGQFNRPEGLGIGPDDRIYVADSCNHRIQVFSPDGQWQRSYGRAGSGPGQFSYPYDVCVDAEGRQYVCEFGNSRLQIFDAQQQVVEILGGPGRAPGQFHNPWSLALDSQGNLYVADSQNHRVQKFVRRQAAVQRLWFFAKAASAQPTAAAADYTRSYLRRPDPPPTPSLSPSEGERVPAGRVRGLAKDSLQFLASEVLNP